MKSSTKIVAGVLGGVVLGVAACGVVAFSYLLGAREENRPASVPQVEQSEQAGTFAVGDCLKQAGNSAVAAACTEAGVYRVVSVGAGVSDCADLGQPYVTVGSRVLCLAPAG